MAAKQATPLIIQHASFAFAAAKIEQLPAPVGVEIAFAGRSNVGKSSLMNRLMARRNLVRTSGTPGCTRQLNFFETIAKDGARVTLVDLPGYGYARRSKGERDEWASLIESYLLGRATLAAVCALFDVRRGLEAEERDLLELLGSPAEISRAPLRVLLVATKLDKLPASQRPGRLRDLTAQAGRPVFGFSAETGEGREALWKALRQAAGVGAENAPKPAGEAAPVAAKQSAG